MENKPSLEYKIKSLPDKSGVYIMKNAEGEVIYVGKAKVLKNRVRPVFSRKQPYSQGCGNGFKRCGF